jgi:hypothetical protein
VANGCASFEQRIGLLLAGTTLRFPPPQEGIAMKDVTRVSAVLAVCLAVAGVSSAASPQTPSLPDAKARWVVLTHKANGAAPRAAATAQLVQWKGKFTDLTHKVVTFTMAGTNPTSTNVTTTIPVYIIPIKMVYGASNGGLTFDPVAKKLASGKTIIQNTIASPVFDPSLNFTQGGTNLGTTQYIDAYQRGNFWSTVKTRPNYHVLLGTPTVLAEQSITVAKSQGQVITNPFGAGKVGTYDINAFDANLQNYMKKFTQINPGSLPIFVTYDVYLTQGGCCIGGYHSANASEPAGQTYATFTYVDHPGSFSEDVSALSHEVGEWMDDPFVDNAVNCTDNNVMENGDPLEGNVNYGTFPYTLSGFTYNLQSLVFIPYFGDARATSVHSWLSFQNDEHGVCPGQ